MSFQTPITVREALEHIHQHRYLLPAIQREFVWTTDQIVRLFDSVLRDYPIGSFLFWQVKPERKHDFQFYRFLQDYHEKTSTHNPKATLMGEGGITAILDGQQRLTSLYIGLYGSYAEKKKYTWAKFQSNYPEKRLYVNLGRLSTDPELQYAFEFRPDKANWIREGEDFWFRVGHILSFEDSAALMEFVFDQGLNATKLPLQTLTRLHDTVTKRGLINYYKEEDQDLDKVLNIFIRVNSGGTKLSYSDLLLSIATAQWNTLDAREEINALVDELNQTGSGFSFSKDFVLKTCLMLADLDTRWMVGNFTKANMERIEAQWPEAVEALRLTVRLLAAFGFNGETLPSVNAVIPIAYYLNRRKAPSGYVESAAFAGDRATVRRWLNVALLKRIFSGQPDVILRIVREVLQKHDGEFPYTAIETALRASPRTMRFEEDELAMVLDESYGKPYAYPTLALLYPWLDFQHHFHQDHIHPRSRFTPAKLGQVGITAPTEVEWFREQMDRIPNLQLLQGLPNQEKSAKAFETWLMETYPDAKARQEYRERHLIPPVDLSAANFREFYEARRALMLDRLKQLVGFEGSLAQTAES
jgi:hypothetical protein